MPMQHSLLDTELSGFRSYCVVFLIILRTVFSPLHIRSDVHEPLAKTASALCVLGDLYASVINYA